MKKIIPFLISSTIYCVSFAQTNLNIIPEILNDNKAIKLIQAVDAAYEQGSRQDWYLSSTHQIEIKNLIQSGKNAELDLYINRKILELSMDLNIGRISPDKVTDAHITPKNFSMTDTVNNYIGGKISSTELVNAISPKNLLYNQALATLKKLRMMKQQGLLTKKPSNLNLTLIKMNAAASDLVLFLRSRLNDLGYSNDTNNAKFDSSLDLLVKTFQQDHNLKQDGIVGKDSWPLLDRSIDELITQATLSLERTRWNPDTNTGEFVYVNFNNQELEYYKNNSVNLTSKVIIGRLKNGVKEARKTPLLVDYVKSMVLNTKWTVPVTIFTNDKLPLLRSQPGYAEINNMYVIDNATGKMISSTSVDWNLDAKTLLKKYSLVQKPGANNALGRLKFLLNNKISIFLHDTNERSLFSQNLRLISSGCVRVEKPFDLAAKILEGTKWTKDAILNFTEFSTVQASEETWVKPTRNIPVYFMSNTVIQNSLGRIVSFNDHYGVDAEMYSKIISVK